MRDRLGRDAYVAPLEAVRSEEVTDPLAAPTAPPDAAYDSPEYGAAAYPVYADPNGPAAAGELVDESERLPDSAAWQGGRAPRDTTTWRSMVAGRRLAAPSVLRPIAGAVIVIAIVVIAIALLARGQDSAVAADPGSARLVIADFGEGAGYAATALGKTTAETVRREVDSGLGAAAARMPTLSAGVIRDASSAAREMRRQGAQALLWGTLPIACCTCERARGAANQISSANTPISAA